MATPIGPPAQTLRLDADGVRALLAAQAAPLAQLSLHRVAAGFDNDVWRLGSDWAVRLPRHAGAVDLLLAEQRLLPLLAPILPLPIPTPVVLGRPEPGLFDAPFSVVSWFDGHPSGDRLAASEAWALGGFLRRLHAAPLPVAEAPRNPVRGVPLRLRAEAFEERLRAVESSLEPVLRRAARASFDAGVKASPAARRVWLHGDLHPRNLVQTHSRLTAVLDWGDLTAGDPATDLAVAWWLFDAAGRQRLWAAYGEVDASTVARARAWAALIAVTFVGLAAVGDEGAAKLGRSALTRLIVSS